MFKTNQTQTALLPDTAIQSQSNPQAEAMSAPWLKLISPNPTEVNNVAQKHDIPVEFILAALNPQSIPRSQQLQHCHLIIAHLPLENLGNNSVPFSTLPFGIIMLEHVVIMVCAEDHAIFDRMLQHHLAVETPESPALNCPHYWLFRLLELAADQFIYAINTVNHYIADVESELRESIKNGQIFKLLDYNKSLNRFATSLKANAKILQQLHQLAPYRGDPKTEDLLLNVMVETEQAQVLAETHNINLCNLMDSYAAAIENNLSLLVQHLSIFVIVGAIPLGIAALYGMNTPLPMQDQPYALATLAVIAVVMTALTLLVFKKRQII